MDAKRAIKQVKKEAYAVSDKKQNREATIDYKKNYKSKIENAIKANRVYQRAWRDHAICQYEKVSATDVNMATF